jgi:hypothetical protein
MIEILSDRHEAVLTKRDQQRTKGSQAPINWEKSKQKIRN